MPELGQRIGAVVRLYASKNAASNVAGVSPDQLTRYERGGSMPPFDVVVRLAAGAKVSLPWLASGEGPMLLAAETTAPKAVAPAVTLDPDLLAVCMRAANKALTEIGIKVTVEHEAKMVAMLYTDMLSATPEDVERMAELERQRQNAKAQGVNEDDAKRRAAS